LKTKCPLRFFKIDDEQPDPQRTEIVKDVIVLKFGVEGRKAQSSKMARQAMPIRARSNSSPHCENAQRRNPTFHSAQWGVSSTDRRC
jgi:hypothetical protein